MKVVLNDLFYLLVKFINFQTLLAIFPDLFPFLCVMEKVNR
jgi:hypothetical protein